MPKDTSTPQSPPPLAVSGAAGSSTSASADADDLGQPLKRNMACLTCRKRKVRCDAEKPACGTCMRSWRHRVQHLPTGRQPPPPPVCDYTEDEPRKAAPASSSTTTSSAGKKKAKRTELAEAEAAAAKENEKKLEGRIQHLETMLMLAVGAVSANAPAAGPTQTIQQQLQHTHVSTSSAGYPLHLLNPYPPDQGSSSCAGAPAYLSPSVPSFGIPPAPVVQPQTWPVESPTSSLDHALPSNSSTSGSTHSYPAQGQQASFDFSLQDAGGSLEQSPEEMVDSPLDDLTELLWPAWPPHLPSPGMMDHLAQVFLHSVPIVHGLLDPGRFLSRLSLPPTHSRFPHPAVLHAICAVAARFTAVVQLSPPDVFKPQYPRSTAERLNEMPLPVSDGLGPLAQGADDFAAIHARWATQYYHSSVEHPAEWLSLCLAATLLAVHYHQSGLLVDCWHWIGQASRLAIPLGLNTGAQTGSGPKLVNPPEDDVDRAERENLFWLIFAEDTFASAASGWAGNVSLSDISTKLPTGIPGTPSSEAQSLHAADFFTTHPPAHRNGFSLRAKAMVLLRHASDFTRSMEVRGVKDLRQDPAFVKLDQLIIRFGESFPANCRDPLKATDDLSAKSVDADLFLAHLLWPQALLSLHINQFNPLDCNDYSTSQVRRACNVVLDRIFRLSATSLDPVLLIPFVTAPYFLAAKAILRMVSAAKEVDDIVAEARLRAEVDVFKTAIGHIGSKLPIGARHSTMLAGIEAVIDKKWNPDNGGCPIGNRTGGQCTVMRFNMGGGLGGLMRPTTTNQPLTVPVASPETVDVPIEEQESASAFLLPDGTPPGSADGSRPGFWPL